MFVTLSLQYEIDLNVLDSLLWFQLSIFVKRLCLLRLGKHYFQNLMALQSLHYFSLTKHSFVHSFKVFVVIFSMLLLKRTRYRFYLIITPSVPVCAACFCYNVKCLENVCENSAKKVAE